MIGLSLLVAAATFAATPVKPMLPKHSIKTHVIQSPVLMPGPVIPVSTKRGMATTAKPAIPVAHEKRVVTKDNNGIEITLPVNKTTGAHWEIFSANDNLIDVLGYQYLGPVSEVFGAPGHAVFKFKASTSETNAPRSTHIILALVAADGHIIQIENVTVTSTGS